MPANRLENSLVFSQKKWGNWRDLEISLSHSFVARQNRVPDNVDFAEPPEAYQLVHLGIGGNIPMAKKADPGLPGRLKDTSCLKASTKKDRRPESGYTIIPTALLPPQEISQAVKKTALGCTTLRMVKLSNNSHTSMALSKGHIKSSSKQEN